MDLDDRRADSILFPHIIRLCDAVVAHQPSSNLITITTTHQSDKSFRSLRSGLLASQWAIAVSNLITAEVP